MTPTRKLVAALTLVSVLLFSTMVPGGPIETRNFANIGEASVILFNIFLTALGIGSLALVYFLLKGGRWVAHATAIAGLGFAVVYALDLLSIFPVSLDPMPSLLQRREIIGMIISLALIGASLALARENSSGNDPITMMGAKPTFLIASGVAILIGAGIVIFASYHAMHS
ncbi:hypothetical protein PO883_01345 [Massilia sp. DJPM01]|uniref:hypothetical protein n=1 Tax=Massilia sp. DJPM01 TaxID=3024404 RepID=UPI00259EB073|nr:hypothetical protein [Massilia sp. DJPM01]MDM5175846.1 hypothetical protein [Massilia sp. DJPM01]